MNNFKKFAAVLLGVVMACVFATSAFAADFNKPNNAKRAREEILSFAASYGVTTIDNTVNKLTADQLNVIYANMDSLKAVAANAVNTIKGTTDANVALKAANDAVASMNSMLSAAGIVTSPTRRSIPATLPSSLSVLTSPSTARLTPVLSPGLCLPPPLTTTPLPATLSAAPPRTVLPLPASRPFLPLRTPSPLLPALSSRPPATTPPLSLLSLLWLLSACSAWPSARSVHCNPAA